MTAIQDALLLLVLLQLKHLLADFVLQSDRMLLEKGAYGRLGGMLHAGLHGGLSLLCILLVGVSPITALLVAVGEAIVHYHIDWTKDQLSRGTGPGDKHFWTLVGTDQLAHQVTYIAMIWVLVQP